MAGSSEGHTASVRGKRSPTSRAARSRSLPAGSTSALGSSSRPSSRGRASAAVRAPGPQAITRQPTRMGDRRSVAGPRTSRVARQTTPASKRMVGSRGPCRSSPNVAAGSTLKSSHSGSSMLGAARRIIRPWAAAARPRRRRPGSGPGTTAPARSSRSSASPTATGSHPPPRCVSVALPSGPARHPRHGR